MEEYLSEENDNSKEEIDMCQALQEMIRDGEMIGEERGRREGGIRTLIEDNLEEHVPAGQMCIRDRYLQNKLLNINRLWQVSAAARSMDV